MPYGLNDEQWQAITAPSPTVVRASAGSGKTRCLVAKIRHLLDSGVPASNILAITFTNKAANEMKERLRKTNDITGMQVSTIHSMCVRVMKAFPGHTPLRVPFSIYDDADQLSVIKTVMKARGFPENPNDILEIISRAKSEGETEMLEGVSKTVYKSYQEILLKNNAADFDDLQIYALGCLKHDDCRDWFLERWRHVLVDEIQDTSKIQYDIILSLYDPARTRTLFCVGDENQCVLPGTMISTDSGDTLIEKVSLDTNLSVGQGNGYTKHILPSRIIKKRVIDEPVVTIMTESGKELMTTWNHIHFAGFHKASPDMFFTYLMYREGYGYRIGITKFRIAKTKGGKHSLVFRFKHRLSQERGDAMWLVGAFKTETEALYHEQLYSVTYGLPTWIFETGYYNVRYNERQVRKLFQEVDTQKGACRLLSDLRLSIDYPHHIPKSNSRSRERNFTLYLCGSERRTNYKAIKLARSHCYSVFLSEEEGDKLKDAGFNVRRSSNGQGFNGYRVEGTSTSLKEILALYSEINKIIPLNLIQKARLGNVSLPMVPASHIIPGMSCFVKEGDRITLEAITSVRKAYYTGTVYDLDVSRYHNYCANGIMTHNSIYGFRGARPDNMADFIEKYEPAIRSLTYNYRCSEAIVTHANGFLQFGGSMVSKAQSPGTVSLTAFQSREDEAERVAQAIMKMGNYEETAVLYRVNARSIGFEQAFSRRRIPYKVVGGLPFYRYRVVKDIISGLKASINSSDVEALARVINNPRRGFGAAKREQLFLHGRSYVESVAPNMPAVAEFLGVLDDIKGMRPLDALNEYIFRTNYQSTITKDSDRFLLDALREAVAQYDTVDELIMASTFLEEDQGKGVKLMTAHASKGLEFDRVFVVGVENGVWPHQYSEDLAEEERLFYVACTRARKYLNVSYCKSHTFRGQPMESMPSQLFKKLYKSVFNKEMVA